MAWYWLKTNELSLGERILKYNAKGKDVRELQELLRKTGFYFGEIDGVYGTLTEEAVFLVQRTLKLKKDGIAGPEVIKTLMKVANRSGRIIYTVKLNENIDTISQKFGVSKEAWDHFPGQGNPRKRLYAGMRLLLREKAVYIWDSDNEAKKAKVTGLIVLGGHLEENGKVSWKPDLKKSDLCVLNATENTWEKLFNSRKLAKDLIVNLAKNKSIKWGINLANASQSALPYWVDLLKLLKKTLGDKQISFIILPINNQDRAFQKLVWANLYWFSKCCKLILLELVNSNDSIEQFTNNLAAFHKIFVQMAKQYPNILPIVSTQGWDWNINQNKCRLISNREAKLIRAINYKTVTYSPNTMLTTVNFTNHGEEHQLFYRDYQGWNDFFNLIKRSDCYGLIFKGADYLGEDLSRILSNSFAVIQADKGW